MSIITLGPLGTFCSEAAKKLYPMKKLLYASSIHDIFFRLSDPAVYAAVVPLENINAELDQETITNLLRYDFILLEKIKLPITFQIAGESKNIEYLFADSYALESCQNKLKKRLPTMKIIETNNNALSALHFKSASNKSAALVSPFTLQEYNLPLLIGNMEDNADNYSSFLALGKTPARKKQKNATLFLIFSKLSHINHHRITKIVQEKSILILEIKNVLLQEGHTPLYFLEVEGKSEDPSIQLLSTELNRLFLVKCLGSYALST